MQLSDFASPAFYADPYPIYERIRSAGPLIPLSPEIFITGKHNMVSALLSERRVGRAYIQGVILRYGEQAAMGEAFQVWSRMMLMMNPPAHTPIRAVLIKAFNARQVEELHRITQSIADDLIDDIAQSGSADLMTQYALPLPMKVICRLLDVPYEDAQLFIATANLLMQTLEMSPMTPEQLERANEAAIEMQAYFGNVVTQRRDNLGDDLISRLLTTEVDGAYLNDSEIIANVMLLFMAGHETTASMIGNTLIALNRNPERLQELVNNPERVKSAVTELLRYDGSVQLGLRVVLEDIEVLGQSLKAGQVVYLLLGSANRDPEVFSDPDVLNFARPEKEERSVSFGGGVHYCLGARLAMMEIETALKTLLQRLPNLKISDPTISSWHQRHTLRGVVELKASWG